MDISTMIECILTFIAGGGVTAVFTLRQTKEGKQLDNAVVLVNEYKTLLEDYKGEAEKSKKEVDSLREEFAGVKREVAELKSKLTIAQTAWHSAEVFRCDKINCPKRIPPFDKSKLAELADTNDKDNESK